MRILKRRCSDKRRAKKLWRRCGGRRWAWPLRMRRRCKRRQREPRPTRAGEGKCEDVAFLFTWGGSTPGRQRRAGRDDECAVAVGGKDRRGDGWYGGDVGRSR